ncbi:MAG: putative oxidoreductase C-terminal domain-containing protein [bacterium]
MKLITLDPGHFHAGLIQKVMYPQVSPVVSVYAPVGKDVLEHLKRIEAFNTRTENPTHWEEKVYTGPDFFEKMLSEKSGNIVVLSGKNSKKAEYIKRAVEAGLNVFADKPMCIDSKGFEMLKEAFAAAEQKGVLLYDMMTERSEITTILQKEFMQFPEVFGDLVQGTEEDPAVIKESVHHFYKNVAGKPLIRPEWFFDVQQQGEGIVDVTTHLVDLVQWECFPEQPLRHQSEIKVLRAKRWATSLTLDEFSRITGAKTFPKYLLKDEQGKNLEMYSNGEIHYTIRGVHTKISVTWNFQAPEGGGDTHFSVIRGSKSNIIIQQGEQERYRPELYIEASTPEKREDVGVSIARTITQLQPRYPDLALEKEGNRWHVIISDKYRVGHEGHFGEVTERYLRYLREGQLPPWEVPNMIAKYYTIITAYEMAHRENR